MRGDILQGGAVLGSTSRERTRSLIEQIMEEGGLLEPSERERARDLVTEFVDQVIDQGDKVAGDVAESIKLRIAQIDELIDVQLDEIIRHPEFQKCALAWFTLHYLIMNSETSTQPKPHSDISSDITKKLSQATQAFEGAAKDLLSAADQAVAEMRQGREKTRVLLDQLEAYLEATDA